MPAVVFCQVGGEEVEYDPKFRLYLQTKLSNPHYKPEIQAQCTLINFIATENGLADQLLARVVNEEKQSLEQQKQALQEAFNRYQIQLLELEDQLLERLSNAPEDILSDVPLIEGLEATKLAAREIEIAVQAGKKTEIEINIARQVYVPVAVEGAMLYFMITQLNAIEHMYQYSLDSFLLYFYKSIREADRSDDDVQRVQYLRDKLRFVVYTWVSRGLFERHKLILLGQLTFQLITRGMLSIEVEPDQFRFLLAGPKKLGDNNPLTWLPTPAWNAIQVRLLSCAAWRGMACPCVACRKLVVVTALVLRVIVFAVAPCIGRRSRTWRSSRSCLRTCRRRRRASWSGSTT
jgi:dynein heavy chain